ncbi:MAG: glutamate 5-kinase [Erysipelotrichaceae bacterium]
MDKHLINIKNSKRIVIKVGSTTLTHSTGKLNLRKLDKLAMILSDLSNEGREIILVSSGAVAAGISKLGLNHKPKTIKEKQAIASVGQCELMYIYDKFFDQYAQKISQILLTKSITQDELLKENVVNTFETLFNYNVIPIINENDSIAVDEIVYGDNDTLSAVTAALINADLLIILSDIDGLYDDNPNTNANAKLIPLVKEITKDIEDFAKDTSSSLGTGGMNTKLVAGKIANDAKCDMIIANGENPEIIYDILEGKRVGTLFLGKD